MSNFKFEYPKTIISLLFLFFFAVAVWVVMQSGIAIRRIHELEDKIFIPPVHDQQYKKSSDTIKHIVRATFFNATRSQCDGRPNVTASGFKINMDRPYSHRIIAVSPDILRLGFNMGDKVVLRFPANDPLSIYNGQWIIRDKSSGRHKDLIDLLVDVDMPMGSLGGVLIYKVIEHE